MRQLYTLDLPARTPLQCASRSALHALARLGISSVLLLCMIWILISCERHCLLILSLFSHRHLWTRPSPAPDHHMRRPACHGALDEVLPNHAEQN